MEKKKENKRKLTLCDFFVCGGILILILSISQPAFTQAKEERQLSALADRLQTVRSHIHLYKTENGVYPGQEHADDTAVTADEFVDALCQWESASNQLSQQPFPVNPYVGDKQAGGDVTCVCEPGARPMGTEPTGWWYNAATGEFCACDSIFHTNY